MEDVWLQWAKRLMAISSTGLHYSRELFDRERYEEIAAISSAMLGHLTNRPIEQIRSLFPDFGLTYATPLIEVRAALIEAGRILLVRERSDGRWTLPGGFADVGKSASENMVKEVWEEASLRVETIALYGLRHRARHEYDADVRDFYKLFFLCRRTSNAIPQPGSETDGADFFSERELPPLSTSRTLLKDISAAFAFANNPAQPPFFD